MTKIPQLFTVEEVAKIFRVSKSSIYRMLDSGMLTHYKISGGIRFAESDILGFLDLVKHKPWNERFHIAPNKSHSRKS